MVGRDIVPDLVALVHDAPQRTCRRLERHSVVQCMTTSCEVSERLRLAPFRPPRSGAGTIGRL